MSVIAVHFIRTVWSVSFYTFVFILCSCKYTGQLLAQPVAQTPFELRADSLLHVAKAMIAQGEAEKGLLLTQEMEGEIVANLGISSWLRIRALVNYGNYFEGKFQFDQAIEKWKEAVALMDTLYHGDHPLYNRVLGSIGSSYNNMAHLSKIN